MRLLLATIFLFTACASKPKQTGILAESCAPTEVRENDLKQFALLAEPGKVVVVRLFATYCPFCKIDLAHIGDLYRRGEWSPDKVKLFLIAYRTHGESRDTAEAFEREDLKAFGIPEGAAQVVYVDQDYNMLKSARGTSGAPLFTGWSGIPFGLVFGKDGRLAYRGQFTSSDMDEKRQYDFITKLQTENCVGVF